MAFDEEARNLISPYLQDGELSLSIVNNVVWGLPQNPQLMKTSQCYNYRCIHLKMIVV